MPPKNIPQNKSIPLEEKMSSHRGIKKTVLLSAIILLLFTGGYALDSYLFVPTAVPQKDAIISVKTGRPLSSNEINSILAKQASDEKFVVISESVLSVKSDMVSIQMSGKDVWIKLTPDGQVIRSAMVGVDGSLGAEDEIITLKDIVVGDTATVVFSKGITIGEIEKAEVLLVKKIFISTTSANFN